MLVRVLGVAYTAVRIRLVSLDNIQYIHIFSEKKLSFSKLNEFERVFQIQMEQLPRKR